MDQFFICIYHNQRKGVELSFFDSFNDNFIVASFTESEFCEFVPLIWSYGKIWSMMAFKVVENSQDCKYIGLYLSFSILVIYSL